MLFDGLIKSTFSSDLISAYSLGPSPFLTMEALDNRPNKKKPVPVTPKYNNQNSSTDSYSPKASWGSSVFTQCFPKVARQSSTSSSTYSPTMTTSASSPNTHSKKSIPLTMIIKKNSTTSLHKVSERGLTKKSTYYNILRIKNWIEAMGGESVMDVLVSSVTRELLRRQPQPTSTPTQPFSPPGLGGSNGGGGSSGGNGFGFMLSTSWEGCSALVRYR
jgi:hypothetical protein